MKKEMKKFPLKTTLMPTSFAVEMLRGFIGGMQAPAAFYSCEPCHYRLQAADPNQEHPETLYCPKCRKEMEYHGPMRPISPEGAIEIRPEIEESPKRLLEDGSGRRNRK